MDKVKKLKKIVESQEYELVLALKEKATLDRMDISKTKEEIKVLKAKYKLLDDLKFLLIKEYVIKKEKASMNGQKNII